MRSIIIVSILAVLANASYEKVAEYYSAKDYRSAIKEAKASTSEYNNPKLHLLWAKSEEALGNTKEAMSAYERVAILDQEDSESRIALLKIYRDTKRDNLSKSMSKELLEFELTPEQRTSLELLQGEDLSSIKAKATLSIGHDSNINVSATESVLDNYNPLNSSKGELSTLFARFNGSVSYIDDLEEKGGFYLRGDVKLYYQNNFDESYYNLLVAGASAGLGYSGRAYTFYMPIVYNSIHYLERNLLNEIQLIPKMNVKIQENLFLHFNVQYTQRSYSNSQDRGMDDSSYGIGTGIYYLFSKNFIYANITLENFSSTDDIHYAYLDKDMLTASLGMSYHLNDWLVTRVDYRYRDGNYEDVSDLKDPTVTTKRRDDYHQVEVKFSHFFAKQYELFVSDRYVNNSSNYAPAKYTKNIAMFGISANY